MTKMFSLDLVSSEVVKARIEFKGCVFFSFRFSSTATSGIGFGRSMHGYGLCIA